MDQRDIAALLALMRVDGAGNGTARRALTMAQLLGASVADAIAAGPRELLPRLPANVFDAVLNAALRLDDDAVALAARHAERVLHHGARCFAYTDEEYPHLLSVHLGDAAPALVWCVGNVELLHAYGAGVVGTRSPSPTGEAIAEDCARLFVREGACIVSGGADGIDTAAHRATLEAGGATVIVLPQGLRTYIFPAYVRDAIESGRCVLVSQFDPELTWQAHAAVTRNATIAALSKLVCVVEPMRMGGSMRTAKQAREQGKPVFFYCGPEQRTLAQTLSQNGAQKMLRDSALDSPALREAWTVSSPGAPRQAEFE